MSYYEAHKLELLEKAKARYAADKGKYSAKAKVYYQNHKAEIKARANAYYETHTDERSLAQKDYYQRYKEEIKARVNVYYQAHTEQVRATIKKRYELKRDEISTQNKAKYWANRDKMLEKRHLFNLAHAEQKREYMREYSKLHPEVQRRYRQKRRKWLNGLRITPEQRVLIAKSYDNKCAYCGANSPDTTDHFIPLALGGNPGFENIVPACMKCNCKKHTMTHDAFAQYMEEEREMLTQITAGVM